MDCFYAAVEIREQPHLADLPVAVGGKPNGRGVLTTCNYKAREFGLRSAMPAAQALKLCPDLVLLPVRMDLYRQASQQIHTIFRRFTTQIEPLSLDEAYLDVTDVRLHRGSATLIAQAIRNQIFENQQLTASAGIASNKFLAKVASDWNKPNGQFVISPSQVESFIKDLPVKKIPGVGPVTTEKLANLGIETCEQLQAFSVPQLQQHFGRFGENLYEYARGIDHRPVKTQRERKSLSVERTFAQNLSTLEDIEHVLPDIFDELQRRLGNAQQKSRLVINGLFVKIKYFDFQITTHQHPGQQPDLAAFRQMIKHCLDNRDVSIRLLGLGVRFDTTKESPQMNLF